ncbi:Hypothetical predicted protein [Olea europaea subsp. europaea]|uniref:Uncharacterized protein n=1 Tax=Olea europaea subsp. europaea TaxID=158383 RepID=A0A8S0VGZ5_OLEEU|nr:Hypothetical predicted protein [Olea europaea subsp. europaea]
MDHLTASPSFTRTAGVLTKSGRQLHNELQRGENWEKKRINIEREIFAHNRGHSWTDGASGDACWSTPGSIILPIEFADVATDAADALQSSTFILITASVATTRTATVRPAEQPSAGPCVCSFQIKLAHEQRTKSPATIPPKTSSASTDQLSGARSGLMRCIAADAATPPLLLPLR